MNIPLLSGHTLKAKEDLVVDKTWAERQKKDPLGTILYNYSESYTICGICGDFIANVYNQSPGFVFLPSDFNYYVGHCYLKCEPGKTAEIKKMIEKSVGLPDNAFRPLKPGEQYHPIMSPNKKYPEVNLWSVLWGIAMAVLFSAAAAYLGLKVGQVFEAAIPIAIIAVGVSGAAKRKNALGENVIIQSIGACSGVIVAGAIFTLPALYILQDKYPEMTVNFFQMFVSSLLGGILGILFLIPFRKYFVSDKHGEYPLPRSHCQYASACFRREGGSQAKPLSFAGLIGGLYDFIVATFGWWNENFTTRVCGWGEMVAEKAKLVMKINTGAAVLGLGYIVGLKYAAIICAGSLVVWLVIVPGMALLFGDQVLNAWNPALTQTISEMSPELIFKEYAKSIGIGGIAMAGVIGIVRSWGIIKSAVGLAAKEMGGKKVVFM